MVVGYNARDVDFGRCSMLLSVIEEDLYRFLKDIDFLRMMFGGTGTGLLDAALLTGLFWAASMSVLFSTSCGIPLHVCLYPARPLRFVDCLSASLGSSLIRCSGC